MSKFTIDFFDLMWLAESVIPPRPIARSVCFDDFSEKHWHNMSDDERKAFFDHVTKLPRFTVDNEDCAHFYARFDPNNQYIVISKHIDLWFKKEIVSKVECYIYNGKYHVDRRTSAYEEYITDIIKIDLEDESIRNLLRDIRKENANKGKGK